MSRGEILHRNRIKQIIEFSGMRWGNITPTDIDGVIEYHNIGWVWIEVKGANIAVPRGQKLAMERFVVDVSNGNKQGVAIVSTHHENDANKNILLSKCDVSEYFWSEKKKWAAPRYECNVLYFVSRIIGYWDERQKKLINQ